MPISDEFHIFYETNRIWEKNSWLGVPMWKLPFDAFVIQELIYKIQPDFIVETGTGFGGSTVYYASLLELIGIGDVITVDINSVFDKKKVKNEKLRRRIIQLTGDSVSNRVFKIIDGLTRNATTIVILDSDHKKEHVLDELNLYSSIVSPESYLIVEDTHVNSHPVPWKWGEGPMEAVNEFLLRRDDFIIDKSLEKHLMTFNPNGFLRRIR